MSVKALLNFEGDEKQLLTILLSCLRNQTSTPLEVHNSMLSDVPKCWIKELAIELSRELLHETDE